MEIPRIEKKKAKYYIKVNNRSNILERIDTDEWMNVFARLNRLVTTHGIEQGIRTTRVSPQGVESSPKPKRRKQQQQIKGQDKIVKKNMYLVGRNSQYERRVVQEQLSPLRVHEFGRSALKDDYQVGHARENYQQLRKINTDPRFKYIKVEKSQSLLKMMLPRLMQLTDPSASPMMDNHEESKVVYSNFSTSEIPKVPDFSADDESSSRRLEEYIGMLTHTKYYFRSSSQLNGVIPKILRNLMNPMNMKTLPLRTTQMYNDMMLFYSNRFDFATVRELYKQLKILKLKPNVRTFNVMMRSILKNSHIRKTNGALEKEILFVLNQMRKYECHADVYTWTTCYNFLNDELSRDVYMENMIERVGVAMTDRFIYTVLRNQEVDAEGKRDSGLDILKFLVKNQVGINDEKLFHLCLKRFLDAGELDKAWLMMRHYQERRTMMITHETLNLFLIAFAERGRLDLSLLVFNSFMRWGVTPNMDSFDMLYKSMVNCGYTRHFPFIFHYLRLLKIKMGFGERFCYWSVKCRSIIKFNYKMKEADAMDVERCGRKLSRDKFFWDKDHLNWNLSSNGSCPSALTRAFWYIGCQPKWLKKGKIRGHGSNCNLIKSDDGTKIQKNEYRKRIRYVAVQNAMLKRVKYIDDQYGALKEELKDRGLLHVNNKK